MTEREFHAIRAVIAFRLIGLPPSHIAGQTGISETAVQHILIDHGTVEKRGSRWWWRGSYSITPETHARLKLPSYISLSVDKAGGTIPHSTAWMALTQDSPVVVTPDGKKMLHAFDGPPVEPFHESQGFDGVPPTD